MTEDKPEKKKKPVQNPFTLTAESQAQKDAGEQGTAWDKGEAAKGEEAEVRLDAEDLALRDTSSIRPMEDRADAILARTERFILDEADDFRAIADRVDARMAAEDSLSHLDLGALRNHVQSLMVTLRSKPEFASILLDSDVRNIVRYARESYMRESESVNVKATKKANKANSPRTQRGKKDAAKASAFSAVLDGLGDLS